MNIGNPRNNRKQFSAAFTLIEIVIVMGIIAVLAGGTIALMGNFGEGAKVQKAETEINSSLAAALRQYETLAGQFPTTDQGLMALVEKPTKAPTPRRWASLGLKEIPVDPWKNEYFYESDGRTYVLISAGSDGELKTDDDISSDD
ncbi:type II secretion system major pseudopilin GspG [Luteolibacter sp. AS25]|uniref:type II secretion system major pseudopilin GspG n=1 Tax=Luteolibacter sp. AS25 TaxID=3135776 RepID=UPI00398AC0CE